jgi:hypothetical protein
MLIEKNMKKVVQPHHIIPRKVNQNNKSLNNVPDLDKANCITHNNKRLQHLQPRQKPASSYENKSVIFQEMNSFQIALLRTSTGGHETF